MNLEIAQALDIVKLCWDFAKIKRKVYYDFEDRYENDLEHSFQVAFLAWFLASKYEPQLDLSKIMKYALIHDLVEIYAGDTSTFGSSQEVLDSKKQRELNSQIKLAQNFDYFPELHESIQDYQKQMDEEAKFVHSIDKLLPLLSTYITKDDYYHQNNVTLENYLAKQLPKVDNTHIAKILKASAREFDKYKGFFAVKK